MSHNETKYNAINEFYHIVNLEKFACLLVWFSVGESNGYLISLYICREPICFRGPKMIERRPLFPTTPC